jgi:hypothetical protein
MRITQSISLSNIQTFSLIAEKARPEAVGNLSAVADLSPDRRHLYDGGDLETANEFWWS